MTPIFSIPNIRALDEASKKNIAGGYVLMKEAASALANRVLELVQEQKKSPKVAIFVGGGNNGGDGLVCGKMLMEQGIPCSVYSPADLTHLKDEAALAYQDFMDNGGKIFTKPTTYDFTIAVDALLGNGAVGELRPAFAEAALDINKMAQCGAYIIAADAPTGFVKANETLFFGFPRLEGYAKETAEKYGKIKIAKLSYKKELIPKFTDNIFLATEEDIASMLPKRGDFGDKRSQGAALIIAGSKNMTGAAALCTEAALRSGAGLVTLACPKSIIPIVQAKLSEPVFCSLPDGSYSEAQSGVLQPGNIPLLLQKTAHHRAVAIGPGISTERSAKEAVLNFLSKIDDCPLILDADAINAVASEPTILQAISTPTILTPHIREYGRLFGNLPENTSEIPTILRNVSKNTNKVILLKHCPIFIADPSGRVVVVPASNSGMAKGGSGDVLTGIMVALLAQGMVSADAAVLATLLHQKAGRLTREKMGAFSMLPSDVIKQLHFAFGA
ncbi:MAG: NAD(P)H-hydrate dehydratase [Fibrobacteraceae bacterium]|nr:NAD(P)H-hydrate dehydratase [Fibrobacteraceae bacterium]